MPRKTIICSKYTILNLALLSLYVILGSLQITLTVSLTNYFTYFYLEILTLVLLQLNWSFVLKENRLKSWEYLRYFYIQNKHGNITGTFILRINMGISQLLLYSEYAWEYHRYFYIQNIHGNITGIFIFRIYMGISQVFLYSEYTWEYHR